MHHTIQHAAAPVAQLVSASVRRIGTVLITGGLGGLGRQVAAWLQGLGAVRVVLASRSGRCGAHEMQSLCCGGGAVTVVRCDVAAQADAAWLAADAVAGPIDVRT
jgi:NAD(P)-dependent dehydrogenase (short-subunit alcohol dehydrogenase family)